MEGKGKTGVSPLKMGMGLVLIAIVCFAIGLFAQQLTGHVIAGSISASEAGNRAVSYINEYLLQPGVTASLINATESGGVYDVFVEIGGQESIMYNFYVTKDGRLLFVSTVDLTAPPKPESP